MIADRVLRLGVRRHLAQAHLWPHSLCLDGALDDVSTSKVPDQVNKVGGLLNNAAATLLSVPPVGVGDVVVGARVSANNRLRL